MAGQLGVKAGRIATETWHAPSSAFGTDSVVFIAPVPCQLLAVSEVHSTAGTDGSPVSLQVTKDVTTDAPGAGTDLLSNNSNVGFDLKGTANTVQYGVFKTTAGILDLNRGDRISIDFAGTETALVGTTVTLLLYFDVD